MSSIGRRRLRWVWPLAAAVLALVPVAGVFTTSRIFFVRDLTLYFWPGHRWLRQTWMAGDWPWWDQFAAAGQSAAANALNQLFLLPVTALRLVLPETVGFNLWVALPFPLAAIGAWLWLRRRVASPAAVLGALIFTFSGPILSTGNFPNLSWSAAFMPWVIWAAERLEENYTFQRVAGLALAVALQALSGEPVTLAATCAVALAYPVVARAADWRRGLRETFRIGAGVAFGALLAAVQLVPLAVAAANSPRGLQREAVSSFWSLHPLTTLEIVSPHFFGHPYAAPATVFPWMQALNSNRDPLFFSVYIGIGAILLGLVRASDCEHARWRAFWGGVAAIGLLFAFGQFTPVYRTLQSAFPVLYVFRYPVKYLLLFSMGVSALSALGAQALAGHVRGDRAIRRPAAAMAGAVALTIVPIVFIAGNLALQDVVAPIYQALSAWMGLEDPDGGAQWLQGAAILPAVRLAALSAAAAVFMFAVWRRRQGATVATAVLCGLAVADPLLTNVDLNPTMPPAALGAPRWLPVHEANPDGRWYVGGIILSGMGEHRTPIFLDAADRVHLLADRPFPEALAVLATQYAFVPGAWGVRQTISYDLPQLWSADYHRFLGGFIKRSFEERARFLRRSGVRYYVVPEPPNPGARHLMSLTPQFDGWDVYEGEAPAPRAYMTPGALVEPDLKRQAERMFAASHDPSSAVLLQHDGPASGRPGAPAASSRAEIVHESSSEVVVAADVGAHGGYLNLLDSYDPYWRVSVDGEPAALLQANVLYRAVHLTAGRHEVVFSYRPLPLYAGAFLSLATGLLLGAGCVVERVRMARRALAVESAGADEPALAV